MPKNVPIVPVIAICPFGQMARLASVNAVITRLTGHRRHTSNIGACLLSIIFFSKKITDNWLLVFLRQLQLPQKKLV
jgi:hypothetical protein